LLEHPLEHRQPHAEFRAALEVHRHPGRGRPDGSLVQHPDRIGPIAGQCPARDFLDDRPGIGVSVHPARHMAEDSLLHLA